MSPQPQGKRRGGCLLSWPRCSPLIRQPNNARRRNRKPTGWPWFRSPWNRAPLHGSFLGVGPGVPRRTIRPPSVRYPAYGLAYVDVIWQTPRARQVGARGFSPCCASCRHDERCWSLDDRLVAGAAGASCGWLGVRTKPWLNPEKKPAASALRRWQGLYALSVSTN